MIPEAVGGPYYADSAVTIYLGDSRQLLAAGIGADADAVITDPPYGIGYSPAKDNGKVPKTFIGKNIVVGDDKPFDPAFLLSWPTVVLFGANHYAHRLPPSSEWVCWDKRDGMDSNDFADCELIWTSRPGTARVWRHRWSGYNRASEHHVRRVHPTQKPVALMRWLISRYSAPGDCVLDPFMGSGTTLRAAKDCGRKAIGIEIDERYCEIAVRRLAQEVLEI